MHPKLSTEYRVAGVNVSGCVMLIGSGQVERAPYKEEAAQRLLAVLLEAIVGLHTSGVAQ